jgi:predicted lysophospholipase L1 biosynthesis ABC-type transport system permease subunit
VLALAPTVLASVRERRRDLALLKALGLRSRQLRAVVGWQTTTILVIAAAVGVPLGIAVGNWTWTTFADSIGVVPFPVVPMTALLAGIAGLLVAGNLLALWSRWLRESPGGHVPRRVIVREIEQGNATVRARQQHSSQQQAGTDA